MSRHAVAHINEIDEISANRIGYKRQRGVRLNGVDETWPRSPSQTPAS